MTTTLKLKQLAILVTAALATGSALAASPLIVKGDEQAVARCMAVMSRFLNGYGNTLELQSQLPGYECQVQYFSNQTQGAYQQDWKAPSVVKFNAWVMEYRAVQADPLISKVIADKRKLAELQILSGLPGYLDALGEQGGLGVDAVAARSVLQNYKTMEREFTRVRNANPMRPSIYSTTSKGSIGGIAVTDGCGSGEVEDEMASIQDPARRAKAAAMYAHQCAESAKAELVRAASESKEQEALAAPMAPMLPVVIPPYMRGPELKANLTALAQLAGGAELQGIDIGATSATASVTLIVDPNSLRSRVAVITYLPLVRQGLLRMHVIPTSLYSGNVAAAARMLSTTTPYAMITAWATGPVPAIAVTEQATAAVAANDSKLTPILYGVPFQLRPAEAGKAAWMRRGLVAADEVMARGGEAWSAKSWPNPGWTARELAATHVAAALGDSVRKPVQAASLTEQVCSAGGECWNGVKAAAKQGWW